MYYAHTHSRNELLLASTSRVRALVHMHGGCTYPSSQAAAGNKGRQLPNGKKDGTTSPINPVPWQDESEKGSPNPNSGDLAVAGMAKKCNGQKHPPPRREHQNPLQLAIFNIFGSARSSGDMVGSFVSNFLPWKRPGARVMIIFVFHVGPHFPNIG